MTVRRVAGTGTDSCAGAPAVSPSGASSGATSTVTDAGTEVRTSTVAPVAVGVTTAPVTHWIAQPGAAASPPGPAGAAPAGATATSERTAATAMRDIGGSSWRWACTSSTPGPGMSAGAIVRTV